MQKHFSLLLILVSFFTACDDTPQRVLPKGKKMVIADKPYPKDREAPIDIPPAPAPYTGPKKLCYEMQIGNNPNEYTRMQFILDDNDSIRGRLDYSFVDRPAIHGSIEGLKEGKFIELGYTFTDSGKRKMEQLVLKMEDDKMYKKNGEMVEENGVMVLENPLIAPLQLFLMKVDCK